MVKMIKPGHITFTMDDLKERGMPEWAIDQLKDQMKVKHSKDCKYGFSCGGECLKDEVGDKE